MGFVLQVIQIPDALAAAILTFGGSVFLLLFGWTLKNIIELSKTTERLSERVGTLEQEHRRWSQADHNSL